MLIFSNFLLGFYYSADRDSRGIRTDSPPLWARFYEIETNRPFFCNRDGIKTYRFNDVKAERRNGYSWYGGWDKEVAEAYEAWKKKQNPPTE